MDIKSRGKKGSYMKKPIGYKSRHNSLFSILFLFIYLGYTTYEIMTEGTAVNIVETYFTNERLILLLIIIGLLLFDFTLKRVMIEADSKNIYLNYRFSQKIINIKDVTDVTFYLNKMSAGRHTYRRVEQSFGTIRIHTKDEVYRIGPVRSCEETVNIVKQTVRLAMEST